MTQAGFRTTDGLSAFSTADSSFSTSSLDFASIAAPFDVAHKPVTVQVSWRRYYQLSARFAPVFRRRPIDPGAPVATVHRDQGLDGDVDVLSFAGSVKLTPRAAIGASFDVWNGDWLEHNSIIENVVGASGPAASASFTGTNRVRGHNASFGLLLTYPEWSVGLVYHGALRTRLNYQNELFASTEPPEFSDSGPNARLRFPRSVAFGLAWRPAPRWTLAFDLTGDEWTESLIEGLPGVPFPVNLFDELPKEDSATRDTVSVSVGAEHLFQKGAFVIPLRLGLAYEPQGAMHPITRDAVEYLVFAGGTGYNTNSLKFDVAVQYRWANYRSGETVSVPGFLRGFESDALGQVRSREWRIKLSMIYRISDTDWLRGLVRKIFVGS
jgi:long-subunit fatty acid transport protein